jgi:hypothetical protein
VRYELTRIPLVAQDNYLFSDPNDYPVDWNDVSPRLGFSWDPFKDNRTVIRGGYGLFYNHFRNGDVDNFLTSGVYSDSFIVNFPANNIDPGPSSGQLPLSPMLANVRNEGLVVNRGLLDELYPPGTVQKNAGTVQFDSPDRRTPYVHTTSIGLTRQFLNAAISVDFIHQASRAQELTRDLNPGLRVNTSRNGRVVRVDPDFTGAVNVFTNLGRSDYDGLELSLDKRLSRGYSYRVSYTLARCSQLFSDQLLDDLQLEEAPCADVRRHNLTVSGTVMVPGVSGLRLSGVMRTFTGTRFTIQDTSLDANQNGILFEPLPAGTYIGNASDGLTIENEGGRNGATGPPLFQLDLRTSYDIQAGLGRALNLYFEIVNVTDHANFAIPSSDQRTLSTFLNPRAIFGGIPPRTAQLGFRFAF